MRHGASHVLTLPRLLGALVALLLFGAACSDDDSPEVADAPAADPWAEIEADFLAACAEATDDAASDVAVDDYCRCVYSETAEFYGTPDAFAGVDITKLVHGEIDEPLIAAAFAGCAELHLG